MGEERLPQKNPQQADDGSWIRNRAKRFPRTASVSQRHRGFIRYRTRRMESACVQTDQWPQQQNRMQRRIRIQIHSLLSNRLQKHPILLSFLFTAMTRFPSVFRARYFLHARFRYGESASSRLCYQDMPSLQKGSRDSCVCRRTAFCARRT